MEKRKRRFKLAELLSAMLLSGMLVFINTSCNNDKLSYTVTFDADGGIPAPAAQKVDAGGTVTAPSPNPAKTDYVFVFWYKDDAVAAFNFQTPIDSDITLHAKWQEESTAEYLQVSWVLNGGAWPSDDNHATKVLKGGTLAEPAAPEKTGYTLDGWYKEAALTNKVSFPYEVSATTTDFTLYAKWITDNNGGNEQGIATVASGRYSYFVLSKNGVLQALGHNDRGQFGTGGKNDLENLTRIATEVAAVYAGGKSSFIVKNDGSVHGTGYNLDGELGLGDVLDRMNFTPIPIDNIKTIAASEAHALLLKENGSLWATGFNAYGRLGTGGEIPSNVFTATNLTSDVIAISAGSEHSLALKSDGTVWGTGYGYAGALGENAVNAVNPSFVQIFSGAKAIAAGWGHSLILANDGTVFVSGLNGNGQLGIGTTDKKTTFTQAIDASGSPINDIKTIAAGYYSSYAIKTDGTLFAAGRNDYGQLGIDDEIERTKFTRVASDVKAVSAGSTHSIIVKNDETIVTCGTVNPYNCLNGSGKIIFKNNDTHLYRSYNWTLFDRNMTELTHSENPLTTGDPGDIITVKPGTYNLRFYPKDGVTHNFVDFPVSDNETVTITYEWVSPTGYRWVVTRF